MKAADGYVTVEGLTELRRSLRQVIDNVDREMTKVGRGVAKTVVTKARGRAVGLGGVAAKSAMALRTYASQTTAGVTLEGGARPYVFGAEFGGRRRPTTQQFQPWRGSGSGAGYFLYPTIRDSEDQIRQEYEAGMDDLMRTAGLA